MRRSGLWIVMIALAATARANETDVARQRDVIYGKKFGVALTMDVFVPARGNGIGIIDVISGSHQSDHSIMDHDGPASMRQMFLDRGYTVFCVMHGSLPKFTVPEAIEDMRRSVRFIRHHADRFQIDDENLGVFGVSSGAHLALMLATAPNQSDPHHVDPVERESARVQAVACFYPPTDFLNYGEPGKTIFQQHPTLNQIPNYYRFERFDPFTRTATAITDPDEIRRILRYISPIYHVSKDDAPSLLVHGSADKSVPLQQSESFVERMTGEGVAARLIVKQDAAHGWEQMDHELSECIDWFETHLVQTGNAKNE